MMNILDKEESEYSDAGLRPGVPMFSCSNVFLQSLRSVAAVLGPFVFALLVTAPAWGAPQRYPAQDASFSEWMERLSPCLKSIESGIPPGSTAKSLPFADHPAFDWRHEESFFFIPQPAERSAEIKSIPGGHALEEAAMYYTLSSGDLSASVGEIEQGGWWPFNTIPDGFDRSLPVLRSEHGAIVRSKYWLLKHIGESNWVLEAKRKILLEFYQSFFFRDQNGVRNIEELPSRIESFWLNAYTGVPCYESDSPGNLASVNANMWFQTVKTNLFHRDSPEWLRSLPSDDEIKKQKRVVLSFNHKPGPQIGHSKSISARIPPLPANFWTLGEADEVRPRSNRYFSAMPSHVSSDYLSGLRRIMGPGWGGEGSLRDITLDETGERAPLESLSCPLALQIAAKYYAIATLDAQVSLSDLIESGFWPYDTFPKTLDLSETLYGFQRSLPCEIGYSPATPARGKQAERPECFSGRIAATLGTREWLLWRKAEILNAVHAELYFSPSAEFLPAEGVDPQSTPILPRFEAFWADPLSADEAGNPMPMQFGTATGQLSTLDVNLLRPRFEGLRISYQQRVPLINLCDKAPSPGPPCCLVIPRRIEVTKVEQSVAWRMPVKTGGGIAEVRWVCDEQAFRNDHVLLDLGWRDEKFAGMSVQQAIERQSQGGASSATDILPVGAVSPPVFFQGGIAMQHSARLVYDGVAPIRARYALGWDEPKGYSWIQSYTSSTHFTAEIPGGQAGIDWLFEPAETSLASFDQR